MSKAQKWIAGILCVCLVVVFVFSFVAIASYADHECPGEHCEICLEISHLQNTLKQFRAAVSANAFMLAAIYVFAAIVEEDKANRTGTLISLKVQLNN